MNAQSSYVPQTQKESNAAKTEANKDIIASLITLADANENKEARHCLRSYKIDAHTKSLEAGFNKFTKETIIKSLEFLHVDGNLNKFVKSKNITELICRIQNLLLDECNICKQQFATKLDEKLLLQCKLCGQNMHFDCLKTLLGNKYCDELTSEEVSLIINPLGLDGLHYLCGSCSITTIPSEDAGLCKVSKTSVNCKCKCQ